MLLVKEGLPRRSIVKVLSLSWVFVFKILSKCIVQIFDEESVYDTNEFTPKEIDEFIDELTIDQFNLVMEWFNEVPKLIYNAEFKCDKCGKEQSQELQGLQNFFV